ncbi:MAG: Glu/Leu/Phe/Val dehydrogenase [Rhodobiaceae bacterium]|nr:Glu/Leu/Phe/Val dehydrogenase [Rhodobiaceae bacterium]MCC0017825.1 Glu/Leu/Phe/Val dehydrogenase [Rhodobiaceae bacterium]MCC0061884.1 Glu/Leu/Phe/Val dehydrogenase [Rhodobiaceae bacterium]
MKVQPVHRGMFSHPDFAGHETVSFVSDEASGLKAIIAVHDTTLGPALGGCRRWAYDGETAALKDVLRLSRGMTLKNAVAGLDLGGGKAVILSDGKEATPAMWHAFGRTVNRLGGDYITAEDVGTGQAAVDAIAEASEHVRGTSAKGLGDPSPYTAWGVFSGLKAAVKHALGTDSLDGLTIAVQGTGNVGADVARLAREDGARLILADIREAAVTALAQELDASVVAVDQIHAAKADVFAPCALGGALNAKTIPQLTARVVAGAANNQLDMPEDAARLAERGILYAPDFVINAGGVISIALAEAFPAQEAMRARVGELGTVLSDIFKAADAGEGTTDSIAVRMARARIAASRENRC